VVYIEKVLHIQNIKWILPKTSEQCKNPFIEGFYVPFGVEVFCSSDPLESYTHSRHQIDFTKIMVINPFS
jgi:hypothetical protein